eukprot:CAMPEP_0118644680 /NCGR_PEP_ID=MMETSP0785-20121206/7078_1 /TAXON_ID=91992 /ORGANISM="Bolidomonas pacifica, Strain CCMP 1866" /LENGTH=65 /DNA_ID=CAMNT_0006536475 /DNA_START=212 /DNA_END=406 /DNA_ORIENTATION=-
MYGTRPDEGGKSKVPELPEGIRVIGVGEVDEGVVLRFMAKRVEDATRVIERVIGREVGVLEEFRG